MILKLAEQIVIKIGSSLVTNQGKGLDIPRLSSIAKQIAFLKNEGKKVILVSSGAIAEGMQRLNWSERPHELYKLQAAAAVGQMGLIQTYESCFQEYKLHTAQLLLTHEDLSDRKRYLNIGSTLEELLALGVIPIINENDSVVTDEICFGDNDMLAALVTNLIDADALVILTDQNGLYTADPRIDPKAKLLNSVMAEDTMLEQMAGDAGSSIGRGGMRTKIIAAKLATKGGASTIIASGHEENILIRLAQGESVGTEILTNTEKLAARKQWIAGLQINGSITLDEGAVTALLADGTSILSVGVIDTTGNFERGEAVHCINMKGEEIAIGLINYSAAETRKILGHVSNEIKPILGYVDEMELIHRNNLVLLNQEIKT